MPKNAYFARYQSPNNILIVPTVSFCPRPPNIGTEQIVDPNTSSPTSPRLKCDNIGEPCASTCCANCDQQNLQVTSSITSDSQSTSSEFSAWFSDNFRNSLCLIQDITSTEAPAFNMSQSIKDLSAYKYKSRNNLVDLTGFNIFKRERDSTSSLSKSKNLRQVDDTKIEQDNTKTNYDENENRDYSESYKIDNISKESSTSEKPTSTHNEGKTENLANGEPKENKTGMEDKMKKYFKQLWKRKFEKLKDRAAIEKDGRAIKSNSKTRQDYKDSKQESSRSKANLQKVPKNNSTKDSRNKIIDSSKKYKSKSETNSRHSPDSIRDRKIDKRPDSIKGYKDFQRSIRMIRNNDDHEIKYKSGNEIKTENLPRKKIPMKSCETTKNKPVIKKKADEHKQSIKTEKRSKVNTNQINLERVETYTDIERAIDQSNTKKIKLIQSVEKVDKNVHLSQCTPSGVQDNKSKLSRKRTKSEYFVNDREPMENTLEQESLVITVKKDVKVDSKNSPILAATVNKPKHKKCKKIKLIINIECPNSDSDNSDQDFNVCCSSPEDFSFLDDFNIDEIVDSLNKNQVDPNKTITTDHDDKKNKPNEPLISNAHMKAINTTKKEETCSHKGQVIEISSKTEDVDMNIEIGSVANTKNCKDEQNMENSKGDRNTKEEANNIIDLTGNEYEENAPKELMDLCKDEQKIKTNSKFDINTKQEANYVTDLTGNGYEENAPKEIINLCQDGQKIKTNTKVDRNFKQGANNKKDLNGKYCDKNELKETINLSDNSNDSVVEVIDITDENEHNMTSKHLQPEKPIQTSTLTKNVNLAKSKFQLLNQANKPSVNRKTGLAKANKKSHNIQHEEKTPRVTVKERSDPTNITKKKQLQSQKSEDPIEASLQAMFNIEENKSVNSIGIKNDVKQINTLDKYVKEKNDNSHNSEDTVEASLKAMFNNYEQNGNIRKHIERNKINGCREKKKENSIQKSAVEVSLESIYGTKHQSINMDIEQPSSSGQHIRKEIDILQKTQVMIKLPLASIKSIVDQKKNLNDKKIEISKITNKNIKIKSNSQEPVTEILLKTTNNGNKQDAEIKINSKELNVPDIKEKKCSPKFGGISNKMPLETEQNILEKANNKMDINRLKTFENTVKKPKDKIINIEKKTKKSSPPSKKELLFDSGNLTKGTLETEKTFEENCLTSPQIDRPQNGLDLNSEPKGEPLQKSVEAIKTPSKTTIDNGEQNDNIRSKSNKSDTIEENLEVKAQESLESSYIRHKTKVTTSVELSMPDKNIEVTSLITSISRAEKSLTANNKKSTLTSKKSNVEYQTKSETVKNNTRKLETIVDALSNSNKIIIKDSELGKDSKMATNTKTKQKQEVSNKSLVPNRSENKKNTRMQPLISKLESRMSEYLQEKYTFSSVIHNGRFSTIYKCFDTKGETYAVKVTERQTGRFMEELLLLLKQYRSRQNSFVLYLMSAFEVQNQWFLLTEYYPKNLKEALYGTYGFHIDQVQILSRQLVDAVNMLKTAGVTHSDIKPTHILLNSAHDRLKLCGFDRSNYSSCLDITPSSGTSSYRAPEVILGFQEYHRIDVWSTALVMFEMATNKTLFMAGSNNQILYQQLCTFGSLDWSMVEQSKCRVLHFSDTSFIGIYRYKNFEKTILINSLERNDNLRATLFQSYDRLWTPVRTKWQITKDMDKLESLHTLLEQMLVLDPRNRLPIQFVGASEFMNPYQFRMP